MSSLLVFNGCGVNDDGTGPVKIRMKAEPVFRFIPAGTTRLAGGVMEDRYNKNIENLYLAIDNKVLEDVFRETHDRWYAEPEFVGHYLAAGPLLYNATGNDEIRRRNEELIKVIVANQREDGYLGTYHDGLEFDYTFSVWNQNFMIKGLLAQYAHFGNEDALQAAMKCADYNANGFLHSDTTDLLFGVNQGIQHATILEEMAHIYSMTGKRLYLDFANYILDRLEHSSIKVITMPNKAEFWAIPYMIGCTKGIEMFNVYFGVLKMYEITGDESYLKAAEQYWKALQNAQIRITGNGTIGEHWGHLGNKPVELTNDLRPNENCVAMGWMKFNADLSLFSGEGKYFDELEKTLYNHLIGAQALDGHDFSYYQGNIGYKIHEKDPGAYSCCRYRGMRILACLPGYVYMQSDQSVAVNLYTPSTTAAMVNGQKVVLVQETLYPKNGLVKISIQPENKVAFRLMLRKPSWSQSVQVKLDGKVVDCEEDRGYLILDQTWDPTGLIVEMEMEMTSSFIRATINEKEHVAVKYGPLVLAVDSRYGTPIETTMIRATDFPGLVPVAHESEKWFPQVKFKIAGRISDQEQMITLVDYASAGSMEPGVDQFRLWIPAY